MSQGLQVGGSRSSPPSHDRHLAVEHFGDPKPCSCRGILRQPFRIEETASGDLMIRRGHAVLTELPDDKDHDVIPARNKGVEEQAMQLRFPQDLDAALFDQLALQCIEHGFADLDSAARQLPARDVGVLDQKNPLIAVDHDCAHPHGQPTGKPPIEVEKATQNRLKMLSDGRKLHCLNKFHRV